MWSWICNERKGGRSVRAGLNDATSARLQARAPASQAAASLEPAKRISCAALIMHVL